MKRILVNKISLLAIMLLIRSMASAQIAGGTYSIGSGGDYETLNAAIADLNTNGLAGNVTFEIKDGHVEDAYNVINSYTGNTDYELVIRPEEGASSVELTRIGGGKVLDFIGARNVILDGRAGGSGDPVLTVYNRSTSGAVAGISFEGSTRDVTVKYCNILYRGFGIRTIGGGINDPENIIIENCVFSTPAIDENIPNLWAINHNCTSTSSMTIRNNVFESPNLGTGSTGAYMAMYIRSGADIYNNFIAVGDIPAENIYGIRTNFGGFVKNINHNTIAFIGGSATNDGVDIYPFYFQHAGTANITNNIIYNGYICGSGCTRGMIKELSTYGGSTTVEENAWTWSGTQDAENIFYQLDGVSENILETYPDNKFPALGIPQFVDFANNDLTLAQASLLDQVYRTLSPDQITDIYGTSRNVNLATKGAVESAFLDTDDNIYNMTAPEAASVTLQDFGTSGRVNVVIENPTTDLTFTPTFTLAPGATIDVDEGVPYDYSRVVNFSVLFTVTAANDTDSKIWFLNVTGTNRWPGGTYSIGADGDFETITEAANSLSVFGIDGDIILELEDGYSGAWGNFFSGPGYDDYSITLRPEAGATEISVFNASVGGRNFILDGRPGGIGESVLTFRSLNFAIVNIDNFEAAVKHVNFLDNLSSSNSAIYGLRVYGNTSNVTIENCSFTTPNGSSHGGILHALRIMNGTNVTIRNNKFYEIKYSPTSSSAEFYAIEINGDVTGKTEIINNAINLKPEKFGPVYGIRINSAVSGEVDIYHNTINIEDSGTGNQTGAYLGISASAGSSVLNIKNNIVSNTSPGTRRGILYATGSGVQNVDFNNVSGTAPFTYTGTITDATEFKSAFINSTTEDVTFTDSSVGDLSPSSSLNSNSYLRTTFNAGIAEDIEGTTRGSFPMKGAYDAAGSGFNDILSLDFDGAYNLVIDSDNATVMVEADPALDRSNLPVDITIPPGATISPDPSIGQNYTTSMQFTVTSENDIDKVWTVTMQDAQVAPSDLSLSTNTVVENTPTNTTFATFITTDSNSEDTHTYELVAGEGDDRNNRFRIVDNGLQSTAGLNFEGFNSLSIRVRTTDNTGLSFEKVLIIDVTDINEAPEDVYIDPNEFDEGIEANTGFIDILVDDEDLEDVHTFTLVAGEGDVDNDKFEIGFNEIEGVFLTTLIDFDFETQDEFSIRIRATDAGGLFVESIANIYLNDVDEAPEFTDQTFEINENSSNGALIGQIVANDPEEGTLTFSDLSGEIGAVFQISSDGQLTVENGSFLNFEETDFFEFEAEVTDGEFTETATIRVNILNVNEVPTDIELDNKSVNESLPIGTLIGILSTEDVDNDDTHSYTVEDGCSECDPIGDESSLFQIVGNELRTNVVFDYEAQNEYFITVISSDEGGLTVSNGYIISINDLPAQITSIELDDSSINENEDSGSTVGTFSTFGEDLSGSYTYTLIAGTGGDDNASFDVSGDQLVTTEAFDFETKSSYSIRVMTNDGSLTSEEIFTISITNVNEAPVVVTSIDDESAEEGFGSLSISFENMFSDPDGDNLDISVSSSSESVVTATIISGNQIQISEEGVGASTITVTASDGNGGSISDQFTFTVTEAPLGLAEELDVQVYPNPTTDFINIGASKSIDAQLIDLNGRTLQSANGQKIQMDLRALKIGMYLLKISDGESSETKRIIKAN